MPGHANQNLVSIRKKFLLSGVSSEYKDLAKFAEDTNSHLFGEELEDSLKKAKGRHYRLQALRKAQATTNIRNMGGTEGTTDQETLC